MSTNINLIDFVNAEEIANESVAERTLTLTPKTGGSVEVVLTGNGYKNLDDIEDKRIRLIRKMIFDLTAKGIQFDDPEINEELTKYQP